MPTGSGDIEESFAAFTDHRSGLKDPTQPIIRHQPGRKRPSELTPQDYQDFYKELYPKYSEAPLFGSI